MPQAVRFRKRSLQSLEDHEQSIAPWHARRQTCVAVGVKEADVQDANAVHICHREPRGPDFACVAVVNDELLQSASPPVATLLRTSSCGWRKERLVLAVKLEVRVLAWWCV